MLSISQFKESLGKTNLDDKQVEELRNTLYVVVENILDNYHVSIKDKCKKHLSTVESRP